jgi:hypothetical protein
MTEERRSKRSKKKINYNFDDEEYVDEKDVKNKKRKKEIVKKKEEIKKVEIINEDTIDEYILEDKIDEKINKNEIDEEKIKIDEEKLKNDKIDEKLKMDKIEEEVEEEGYLSENEKIYQKKIKRKENFCNEIGMLFNNKDFSDIIIIIKNNKEKPIYCHKFLLSIRSPVFYSMFNMGFLEGNKNEINIPNYEYHIFHKFLEYIYFGICKFNIEDSIELIKCADQYQVLEFRDEIIEFFYKINIKNVIGIIKIINLK